LVPGATYYARVVPVYFNGGVVRGQPSDGVSFVPSRGSSAHMKGEVEWGRYPLNGGFETRYDASGPPDHWSVAVGTWATQFDLVTGSGAVSGDRYLKYLGAGIGVGQFPLMRSAIFTVEEARDYDLSFWAKRLTTPGGDLNGAVGVEWLDSSLSVISSDGDPFNESIPLTWTKRSLMDATSGVQWVTAPANAKFARMYVWAADSATGGEDATWGVDQVRLEPMFQQQPAWKAPSLQNSWANVGGAYQTAGYRKSRSGRVYLRGLIGSGTVTDNTLLFTLDSGYRPTLTEYATTICSNSGGSRAHPLILLESDGEVRIYDVPSGYNAWLSLSNISFDTT
jgi:hypothetical protein